jgi:hypothetical protein
MTLDRCVMIDRWLRRLRLRIRSLVAGARIGGTEQREEECR